MLLGDEQNVTRGVEIRGSIIMEGYLTPLSTTIPPSSLKEPSFFGRKRLLDETREAERLFTFLTILRICFPRRGCLFIERFLLLLHTQLKIKILTVNEQI